MHRYNLHRAPYVMHILSLLQSRLTIYTGNTLGKKIKMNYASYATSIQLKHHIELIGWPVDVPFQNPSAIGVVADARKLRDSLLLGACIWKVMNPARRKQHEIEVVATTRPKNTRKVRSDKGSKKNAKPVKRSRGRGSRNIIGSDEEEATGDDDDDEEEEEEDELDGDEQGEGNGEEEENDDGEVGDEPTVQLLGKRKAATTSQMGVKKKRKTGDTSVGQGKETALQVAKKSLKKRTPHTTGKRLATSKKNVATQLPPGPKSKEMIDTDDDHSTD